MVGALLEVAMSKKCTPLWHEAHFQVKMYKTPQCRSTFGNCDVEKVHAVVARSRFPSQNVQNTPCMDRFWKLRCLKSARRSGAKHMWKWTCTKHTMYGPFLEVQMSFRVAGARDCGPCQKWAKREGFVAFSTTTTTTLHYTPIRYTTLQLQLQLHLHYILLHYITLHYTTLHSITLNYTTLHYTTLHYTTLHCTTLHYTTPHYTTLHYLPLHYITLHYTPLHYTSLQYTTTTTAHSISRNDGRRGAFEEDLQRCMSRGRCSTKDMFIRDVRRSGRSFPEKGLHFGVSDLQVCWDDFAWQVQHVVWPGINFSWQAQYFTQVEWKNRKTHWYEAPSAALNFPFLTLLSSNIEDVSQNCCGFCRC